MQSNYVADRPLEARRAAVQSPDRRSQAPPGMRLAYLGPKSAHDDRALRCAVDREESEESLRAQ